MPRRKDARRGGAGKSSGATAAVGSGAGSAADVRTRKHDVSPDCKADASVCVWSLLTFLQPAGLEERVLRDIWRL